MLIFHIAEKRRWEAAKVAGSYAWSTHGRTLDEEGFIHAAREDQWRGVRDEFYAEVSEPLVLLVIDSERLSSPWQEDRVGPQIFPHIYGPLNPSAVIEERPVREPITTPQADTTAPERTLETPQTASALPSQPQSFLQLFLGEFIFRIVVAVAVMAFSAGLGFLAAGIWGDAAALWGMLTGLAVGIVAAGVVFRRRSARLKPSANAT